MRLYEIRINYFKNGCEKDNRRDFVVTEHKLSFERIGEFWKDFGGSGFEKVGYSVRPELIGNGNTIPGRPGYFVIDRGELGKERYEELMERDDVLDVSEWY